MNFNCRLKAQAKTSLNSAILFQIHLMQFFLSVLVNSIYFPGDKYLPIDASNNKELNFGFADFTISYWIKTRHAGTIIAKVGTIFDGYDKYMKIIYIEDGVIKVQLGKHDMSSTVRVTDNRWHHAALSVKALKVPNR